MSTRVGWSGIENPLGYILICGFGLFLQIDFDQPLCCSCHADVTTLKATLYNAQRAIIGPNECFSIESLVHCRCMFQYIRQVN